MDSIYYPEKFGAKADGKTLDTEALQAAIDACHNAGGGLVMCGPGVYRTGSIDLKSNVELHLGPGCVLEGSSDLRDYRLLISDGFYHEKANEGTALYLIGASHAQNIAITGPGEVQGNGTAFYDTSQLKASGRFAVKPPQRPRLVMFDQCRDVRITEARFIDCACWTFWLMLCERVMVHGITILSDPRLLNSDGIDFDGCREVTVSDCVIRTEDDCLVFRAIQKVHEPEAICENITVSNCLLESTHQCIRISCPGDHITRRCVFTNLTMRGSRGIFIDLPQRFLKSESPTRGQVSDISFSNCVMDCSGSPIRIAVEEGIQGARISGIDFSNFRIKGGKACVIQGNSDTVIEDIGFHNIRLEISGDEPIRCSRARRIRFSSVEIDAAGPFSPAD